MSSEVRMRDNFKCCLLCGKKGSGLMEGASFQDDAPKIRGAMEKIFEALGLSRENISLVGFLLEKPQTFCASCHSSMQTMLALQGEVTALEAVMRRYAVEGIGEAIRNSLGSEDQDDIRPATQLDDMTKVIMWRKFQRPVLRNFASGRIRAPSQDEDDYDDTEECESADEDLNEEEDSSSTVTASGRSSPTSISPPVIVVKEEELEEGEVREREFSETKRRRSCTKRRNRHRVVTLTDEGEQRQEEGQRSQNRPASAPAQVTTEPQAENIEIDVTSVDSVAAAVRDNSAVRRENSRHPLKRIRTSNEGEQRGGGSKVESRSKRQREDESTQVIPSTSTPATPGTSSSCNKKDKSNQERRQSRSPRANCGGCGWTYVITGPTNSSRRDKTREWRCETRCRLNITGNGNDMRSSLVECRGQTVKRYGFVPEREEQARRGERRRMGGRCVVRGCHCEGEWLDVPGLLHHIHGKTHLKGLDETSSK